jgi:hypothetical protein
VLKNSVFYEIVPIKKFGNKIFILVCIDTIGQSCYTCAHDLAISFFGRCRWHWNRCEGNDSWGNDIRFQKQPNSNQSPPPIKHTMYIDKISKTHNNKIHTQYLLRTSKREGKKIIKTTILNLTSFGKEACEAMVYALKNKKSLARLIEQNQQSDSVQSTTNSMIDLSHDICPVLQQGKSIGAVWLLSRLANNLGITNALGDWRFPRRSSCIMASSCPHD